MRQHTKNSCAIDTNFLVLHLVIKLWHQYNCNWHIFEMFSAKINELILFYHFRIWICTWRGFGFMCMLCACCLYSTIYYIYTHNRWLPHRFKNSSHSEKHVQYNCQANSNQIKALFFHKRWLFWQEFYHFFGIGI